MNAEEKRKMLSNIRARQLRKEADEIEQALFAKENVSLE